MGLRRLRYFIAVAGKEALPRRPSGACIRRSRRSAGQMRDLEHEIAIELSRNARGGVG